MGSTETFYDAMRRHGISRRCFLKFCIVTATSLGLAPHLVGRIAHALENEPRIPVVWLHGPGVHLLHRIVSPLRPPPGG